MASRKRKTINIKRVTTRSVGGQGIQKYINASGILDCGIEQEMMENEERLQRLVDNFWGLDKDLKDRQWEISLMGAEDKLSMMQEYCLRMELLHKTWDHEFYREQRRKEELEREEKVNQRLEHLRLINSPYPVEEVLHVIWNLKDAEPAPLMPNIATLSLNSLYSQPTEHVLQKELMEGGELDGSMSSLEATRMPLHLEGLQRSREIVDQAKASMKNALKDIYSATKDDSMDAFPPPQQSSSPTEKVSPSPSIAKTEEGNKISLLNLVIYLYNHEECG